MKRVLGFLGLAVLLCLLVSCDYQQKQRKVKAGAKASASQLPKLRDFETIKVSYGEGSSMESCHYAGATIMLGTSMSKEEALYAYADELQLLGWRLVVGDEQYEHSRVLIRGEQERIRITSYPGWRDETDEDYIRAKETYPTIIFVSLTFYVPYRDGC